MPYYTNPIRVGLDHVQSLGDGTTVNMRWFKSYPVIKTNKIAYNIYYSTIKEHVFTEGVKYVSNDGSLEANIIDLTPGQEYFFSVRPVEYNPSEIDLSILPDAYDTLKVYPFTFLRQDISDIDTIIPVTDITSFPNSGIIKIGIELIQYSSIDHINTNFIVSKRGYGSTVARIHTTTGFDSYTVWDPIISLHVEEESSKFDRIFVCQSRFEYPNFPVTLIDGYHQVTKDLLTSDLETSDASNVGFPMYDYAGYHRTDPVLLLNGTCVGSYIGGEMGCIDGYGNYNLVRGLNLQDHNDQRQEIELSFTGRAAVLIQRMRTGITCSCYLASSEYPDDRCPFCLGTKFVHGYQQYFNPRRSDGRILIRVSPTDEQVKMYEAGLESEFPITFWSLTVPTIKSRDIIILFDIAGNEEFRYEVLSITRNNTLLGQQGGQICRAARIRKFDPAYQIRVFRDTAMFPTKLNTTISFVPGIPPHIHTITRNESDPSNWSQTTSVSQGHNHPVIIQNGLPVLMEELGHTHDVIIA